MLVGPVSILFDFSHRPTRPEDIYVTILQALPDAMSTPNTTGMALAQNSDPYRTIWCDSFSSQIKVTSNENQVYALRSGGKEVHFRDYQVPRNDSGGAHTLLEE